MKNCPNCGAENKDEAKFCKGCRFSFVESVAAKKPDVVDHLVQPKPKNIKEVPIKNVKPSKVSSKKLKPLVVVASVSVLVALVAGVGIYFYSESIKPNVVNQEVDNSTVVKELPPVKPADVEPVKNEVVVNKSEPVVVPSANKEESPFKEELPTTTSTTSTSSKVNVVAPETNKVDSQNNNSKSTNQTSVKTTTKSSSVGSADANRQKLLELKRQLGQ